MRAVTELHLEPISADIAALAGNLPEFMHGDPADRLIAATAILPGSPRVTADERLRARNHACSPSRNESRGERARCTRNSEFDVGKDGRARRWTVDKDRNRMVRGLAIGTSKRIARLPFFTPRILSTRYGLHLPQQWNGDRSYNWPWFYLPDFGLRRTTHTPESRTWTT